MTRTRKIQILRVIAQLFGVLTVLIAGLVVAQTKGAGQSSGTSHAGGAPGAAAALLAVDSPSPAPPLFLPAVTFDSGGIIARSVAVADVNGDGKPDVLVTNFCVPTGDCAHTAVSGSVAVFLGNGDGTFQAAVSYDSGGSGADSIAVADVNGDGKLDLVVSHERSTLVGVLLGNGDGTFRPAVGYGSGGQQVPSLAVADVNGDTKLDVLVAHIDENTVGVLLGNGDGSFLPVVTYDSGGAPDSIVVADVNGDSKPDLVVANQCAGGCNGTVGIFLGNGDGTFQAATKYGSGGLTPFSVAVSDMNADGKPDVVLANACANGLCESSVIGVLLGNGDGTFQNAVIYNSGGIVASAVVIAEVNGDGKPDVVAANRCDTSLCLGSGPVGVLLGNGDGTLQSSLTYSSGAHVPNSLKVADIDGDGEPDVIVANTCLEGDSINCPGDGVVSLLFHVGTKLTTTTLTSSLNPSVFGQGVTFTATVHSDSGTPTGTVLFFDGSTELGSATLMNRKGSISVSSLTGGSHSIVAVYQGSRKFKSGASAPFTQVVNSAATTTSLASSQNPAVLREFVTYTAAVNGQYAGEVTGTMVFQDGGTTIATVGLSGNQAAFTTNYITTGVHPITAMYSGDANNTGSVSPTLPEQINMGFPTKTVLATSGSPSFVGQSVTFTATVTPSHGAIPDGELVTFYDGATAIGTAATASGTAMFATSSLTAKTHTIKGYYPGDATFRPSSAKVIQVVNGYPTTTTLLSSPNPSTSGQPVLFTATVTSTGPTPTGTVKFLDGATTLGSATVKSGVAKLTKKNLTVGSHPITAQYLADAASAKSTSAVVNQVVQ